MGMVIDYLKDLFFADDNTFRGNNGERMVQGLLKELPEGYWILNDIIIDKEKNGTSQIDHVVVSKYGIFVIETKNYSGKIYGSPYKKYWYQYLGNKKFKLYNPMMQNRNHILALESHLHVDKKKFIPIEVFSATAEIKVEAKGVIYPCDLVEYIKNYKEEILTREEVIAIYYKLRDIEKVGSEAKEEHIEYVKEAKRHRHRYYSKGH